MNCNIKSATKIFWDKIEESEPSDSAESARFPKAPLPSLEGYKYAELLFTICAGAALLGDVALLIGDHRTNKLRWWCQRAQLRVRGMARNCLPIRKWRATESTS